MRVDQKLRYRLIEIIALWEGRLTTNHLCQAFDIGRQQASKDINTYIREFSGTTLVYDRQLKGYTPGDGFKPQFCEGHAHEYLQLLDKHDELGGMLSLTHIQSGGTHVMDAPSRYVEPHIIRTLIKAARNNLTLEGHYDSLAHPSPDDDPGRLFAPHTLVFNGFRWHVRAWCEKNQEFRDFVISRFRGQLSIEDKPAAKQKAQDEEWNTLQAITLIPNPRLSQRQQVIIGRDYGMDMDSLSLTHQVSKALLPYYLRRWAVSDPYNDSLPAEYQHVVVATS
ncbi:MULTISPECIES: WYL domain-containing protein [Ferrimonas]|uniref:WYL domain-containing protein n=1 Tax=Ferrimonas TaxID=44011 RepID=UPI00041F596A|nr:MULTISPECIES: WYL domain-containing protein [Ferrimonas]USD39144.1 WYL domain-containing protein [Ferrimonas sp. SCSIO 43195]